MKFVTELPEEDGVLGVGSIAKGQSVWGSRSLNRVWTGRLHLLTMLGRSSELLHTRPPDWCLCVVQRALW